MNFIFGTKGSSVLAFMIQAGSPILRTIPWCQFAGAGTHKNFIKVLISLLSLK